MLHSDIVPTRSTILKLREDQSIIHEAYDFLDEKRLILAAELLRQLKHYEALLTRYESIRIEAAASLETTIRRHGLQGTQVYPGKFLEDSKLAMKTSKFMGVSMISTQLNIPELGSQGEVCQPSPEARHCRNLFTELIGLASVLAGVSGNLHRLLAEYRRTERRARALENVVIPEIEQTLRDIGMQLEEMDQEDIVRVHLT